MRYSLLIIFLIFFLGSTCSEGVQTGSAADSSSFQSVLPGASQMDTYLHLLDGKTISLVVNHTSTVGSTHLVDTLLSHGVLIDKIFAPEHGFRGTADAGEHITDQVDEQTGIQIISLYGSKRAPDKGDLDQTDLVIFDIQDVGARFYTYISTMHYVMLACAQYEKPIIVFDRPNPNGHYIDGPIREPTYQSFVGMHPVPVVYGMTIGEYAQMINGEGWLDDQLNCDLRVIPVANYTHQTLYEPPVPPSPNLPNLRSILLYPSLCFFEGTPISIGRGTSTQFQVIGHPDLEIREYSFTPKPMFGAANPKLKGQESHGINLVDKPVKEIFDEKKINLSYLLQCYDKFPDRDNFFNSNGWFDKLAGTVRLREDIQAGKTESEIRESWELGLATFHEIRAKYLLYE